MTLVTAGRMASADFPDNYFSHVFIDEAGHAQEPEAVIAVAGDLAHPGRIKYLLQFTLAGVELRVLFFNGPYQHFLRTLDTLLQLKP